MYYLKIRVMIKDRLNNMHPYLYAGLNRNKTFDRNLKKKKNLPVDLILDSVCEFFNVDKELVLSASRKRELVVPRQIIMQFMREYTPLSTNQIGRIMNRDHSTVITSTQSVESFSKVDKGYRNKLDHCRSLLLLEELKIT